MGKCSIKYVCMYHSRNLALSSPYYLEIGRNHHKKWCKQRHIGWRNNKTAKKSQNFARIAGPISCMTTCHEIKFDELQFTLIQSWTIPPNCRLNFAVKEYYYPIHLIPKWRLIYYSLICMSISPLCLTFVWKFFCVLHMLTRQRGLIYMKIKE